MDTFIADGVKLINTSNITVGKNVSIWYNSVLRADINKIEIGDYTNIQDLTMIHVDEGYSTKIGNYVTVGHGCILHGCQIGDNTLIGMGATILNGAKIGKNCIIGANSLIKENMIIPDNSLVVGVPGVIKKELDKKTIEKQLKEHAIKYWELAKLNREF